MKKYLIINSGSDSKKYAFYEDDKELLRAHFEFEKNGFIATIKTDDGEERDKISEKEYSDSAKYILNFLLSKKYISSLNEIDVIGFRIVAPGSYFRETRLIDEEYIRRLKELYETAPLHINVELDEINDVKEVFSEVKMLAISDNAFHRTISQQAGLYALPNQIIEKYDIRRYGYHGLSVQSVLRKIGDISDSVIFSKIILCHLGSGASITAIKDGKSYDTSMGFTPIEGLPMRTRSGNIDAGALLYLIKKMNLSADEMDKFLNNECGLLGIAGQKGGGVRELLLLEKDGDEKAKLALDVFVYNIKKYIGAYVAILGGLDLLVFTATIGERSDIIRARVCFGLETLGIGIDEEKNHQTIEKDGFIESGLLPVKVAVVKTDEMGEMLKEAMIFDC